MDVSSDGKSQTFTVLSWLPLTIRFPSGLKLTLKRMNECPSNVSISLKNNLTGVFATLADEDHVKKSKIMQE